MISSIGHVSENDPLVSIVAPTYRHGAFLREAVQSVLDQSYDNWELLVREDGNPDSTVLRGIDDRRVRFSGQESRGLWRLHETYNDLLNESKGGLIAILEGDDRWPSEKLAHQVQLHRRYPEVVVSFGEAVRIDQQGNELSRWTLDGVPVDEPFDALPLLVKGCPIAAVTAMIRRDALVDIGGFSQPPGMPAVDYPTWMELALKGQFLATPELLGYWRVHSSNASTEHVLALARGSRSIAVGHSSTNERPEVQRHWDRVENEVQRSIGRSALARRDWSTARRAFAAATRLHAWRDPASLAKVLAGFVLAVIHVSLPLRRP
jgi:hypothetical protein